MMGVWPSDSSPSTAGSLEIFVRVTYFSEAVAGIPVSIVVNFPGSTQSYGPVNTDSYGLAKFTVNYGGTTSARPVYVTGNATVNGQKLSEQTYFVPQ